MEDSEFEKQMSARVRRHMLTSFGGFLGAIVFIGAAGAGARAVLGANHPAALAIIPAIGILMIPAIGFWSTFRNLRCPSCNHLVAFHVSAKFSAFGSMASDDCRNCGQRIFSADIPRRFRRTVLFAIGVGFALAVVTAVLGGMSHRP